MTITIYYSGSIIAFLGILLWALIRAFIDILP